MAAVPRVLVIGLDSVPPSLLFDRFAPVMPNVRRLREHSSWGTLHSCDPPITVPAWAVMFSGMDPGSIGLYGFRHRRPGSYTAQYLPTPGMVAYPQVWDLISRAGRRVCVVGMPPGYPPPRVNGVYVSDFLTPDGASDFVSPSSLAGEIRAVAGGYTFDVTFRAEDRDRVKADVFRMTHQHFAVARHLWKKEPWDFFALHEIGPDRVHHAFWKFFDPSHPQFRPGNRFESVAEEYYRLLDKEIGEWLDDVPDDVTVIIASDHGSQAMRGSFCVNEWLRQEGYLVLREPPLRPGVALEEAAVDWSRTTAWGSGGYYARIELNLRGREREGIVSPEEAPRLVGRLTTGLESVRRPDGELLGAQVLVPRAVFREVRGDAPDLMVYFGGLEWRSAGTLGHDRLFLSENDTGPDDAVHSFDGVFLCHDPAVQAGAVPLPEQRIQDVAPTVLAKLGLPIPAHMLGRPIEIRGRPTA